VRGKKEESTSPLKVDGKENEKKNTRISTHRGGRKEDSRQDMHQALLPTAIWHAGTGFQGDSQVHNLKSLFYNYCILTLPAGWMGLGGGNTF
jgi:hypothetical protein